MARVRVRSVQSPRLPDRRINLDTLANGGVKPETVLPGVKRFLLDNNVRWRNLINGTGAHDFAKAYAVTEIPASFLVGRDGTITQLHLSRKTSTLPCGKLWANDG